MHINSLPVELLSKILSEAVAINRQDGVRYIYGICESPVEPEPPVQQRNYNRRRPLNPSIGGPLAHTVATKYEKYVKGYNHMQDIDAVSEIRQVCRLWHEWSMITFFREIRIQKRPGSEKWADIAHNRTAYSVYELIDSNRLRGAYVYRDPYYSLYQTMGLISQFPSIALNVHRLWINGFYDPNLVSTIAQLIGHCTYLTKASLPWTVLRYFTADDWIKLLRTDSHTPLQSLELLGLDIRSQLARKPGSEIDFKPLEDPRVRFDSLRRLKIYGDTSFRPVTDYDLNLISKSVHSLEEFHLTCNSSVSMAAVVNLIKASQHTLKLLEHSPRSQLGFDHPHPGYIDGGEHLCELLTQCPRLETLSVSLPYACPTLFANENVKWSADCQVRAARLCPEARRRYARKPGGALGALLNQSRQLMKARNRLLLGPHATPLTIEFFYADCIFDPHLHVVHGYFEPAEVVSRGAWPRRKAASVKGPYGSTGVYKGEDGVFEQVDESEYMCGLDSGWIRIE